LKWRKVTFFGAAGTVFCTRRRFFLRHSGEMVWEC
jgi:hypothetical protein